MKVNFSDETNLIPFERLSNGDVFLDDSLICMKMEPIRDRYGDIYNGVDLRSGEVYMYDDDNTVVALVGELNISRVLPC